MVTTYLQDTGLRRFDGVHPVTVSPCHRVTMSSAPAVRCRGVTKDFGSGDARVQALRGVDLEVAAGEMTLLVGPSGCGKTTLISVIAGLLDPTAGDVEVLGASLTRLRGRQLVDWRSKNIGFVF